MFHTQSSVLQLINKPVLLEAGPLETHASILLTRVSPSPPTHPPLWSDVFTVVQLRGLWEEMATHPRARHAEQILLVSHPRFPHFLYMLLLFLQKFGLLGSAEVVARVLHDWAGDIDGSKRGASAAGDASGIQHIFHRLMQPVRD